MINHLYMKILTKIKQNRLLDFICEQYAVACQSYKKGALKVNNFVYIQTQAYNAAEAIAGKRGLEILHKRQEDINIEPDEVDRH